MAASNSAAINMDRIYSRNTLQRDSKDDINMTKLIHDSFDHLEYRKTEKIFTLKAIIFLVQYEMFALQGIKFIYSSFKVGQRTISGKVQD